MVCSRLNLVFPLLICGLLGATKQDQSNYYRAASPVPHKDCTIAARLMGNSDLHCIKPILSHVTQIQGRRILRGPGWNAWCKTNAMPIIAGSTSMFGNPYPGDEPTLPSHVITPLRC